MFDVTTPGISLDQLRLAGVVGANVRLSEILMRSGQCDWKGPLRLRDDIVLNIRATYESSWMLLDDKIVVVTLHAIAAGAPADEPSNPASEPAGINVDAVFDLYYELLGAPPPEDKRDELFSGFAAVNGPLNGWPYFREFVDSSVRRLGVNRGTLPLFRVPKFQSPPPAQTDKPK